MVDTTWAETTLHDFIASSKAEQEVRHWNADVVERDVTMSMWRAVKTSNHDQITDKPVKLTHHSHKRSAFCGRIAL